MSDIDEMRIRRLDLTVLLVFLGLMREQKAVAVAEQMGLTQSSISHSLKRLREVFDDDLFLRKPHGLEPTAVARALEPRVRSVVDILRQSLRGPAPFDPTDHNGVVRIAAFDYELAAIVPALIARLAEAAPGIRVVTRPLVRDEALRAITEGAVDLALGFFWARDDAFVSTPLFEETYTVVTRPGHPLLEGKLTAKRYAAARHLVVSPAGDLTGIVDRSLEPLGLTRAVTAAVPLFFPALAAVAASDLVATLPSRLVARFASAFGLESRPVPFAVRPFAVSAVRHRRDARSPLHVWLVETIADITADRAVA
ncbi:LysR family transcriptional regulator [Bauldia sp.]|uniref:LysR family transcriptional regulator n=1 Tax=Bauldia sp. TaxID=2575872 RepID=UPI003BAA2055